VVFGWGGEIKNLGPLPFGGPLKKCFPETKKFCQKTLGRGEVPKIFSNTRFNGDLNLLLKTFLDQFCRKFLNI
jgi:hypothetical protein